MIKTKRLIFRPIEEADLEIIRDCLVKKNGLKIPFAISKKISFL